MGFLDYRDSEVTRNLWNYFEQKGEQWQTKEGCCRAFYTPPRDSDSISISEFGDADSGFKERAVSLYLPPSTIRGILGSQQVALSSYESQISHPHKYVNIKYNLCEIQYQRVEPSPYPQLFNPSKHSTSGCTMRSIKCIPPTCLLMWCTVHNSHLGYHPNYAPTMNLTWLNKSSRSVDI